MVRFSAHEVGSWLGGVDMVCRKSADARKQLESIASRDEFEDQLLTLQKGVDVGFGAIAFVVLVRHANDTACALCELEVGRHIDGGLNGLSWLLLDRTEMEVIEEKYRDNSDWDVRHGDEEACGRGAAETAGLICYIRQAALR